MKNPCQNCLMFPLCKNRVFSYANNGDLQLSINNLSYLAKVCNLIDIYLEYRVNIQKCTLCDSILEVFSMQCTTRYRFIP
jgi:hypothetical protein